jgi:hypothetical protein
MPNHRMAKAQQTGLQRRPCGIIPVSALWILCRYRHKIHGSGHSSRLNREGVTQRVKFGSELYSKEELIAELGAAFLSNEAGILDSVRFENSAAYLASWTEKLAISSGGSSTRNRFRNARSRLKGCRLIGRVSMAFTPGFPALLTSTRTATGFQRLWNGRTEPDRSTGFHSRHSGNPCRYEKSCSTYPGAPALGSRPFASFPQAGRAASPCRARLRKGSKRAQLFRTTWLRPPIHSILAPSP